MFFTFLWFFNNHVSFYILFLWIVDSCDVMVLGFSLLLFFFWVLLICILFYFCNTLVVVYEKCWNYYCILNFIVYNLLFFYILYFVEGFNANVLSSAFTLNNNNNSNNYLFVYLWCKLVFICFFYKTLV
jgi:hypothetical protein